MKALFVLLFLLCFTHGYSQTYGYFGKKNVLTINGMGCMPMVYWFTRASSNYKPSGSSTNSLTQRNDLIDGGFLVSLSHAFSGSFGLGIEYGLNFQNITGPTSGVVNTADNSAYFSMKHEQINVRTMTILPKIEYTFMGEQFPIGINNQFGIGFSTTKPIEKDYAVKPQFDSYADPTVVSSFDPKKVVDYDMEPVRGITILYAFNVRTPISRSILLNYGIRYTLNLDFGRIDGYGGYNYYGYANKYYVDDYLIRREIGNKRLSSIIMLNFGINYVF